MADCGVVSRLSFVTRLPRHPFLGRIRGQRSSRETDRLLSHRCPFNGPVSCIRVIVLSPVSLASVTRQ
eukprot:scaffold4141_cov66-Cyclotella_meneghiniana.AAC.5